MKNFRNLRIWQNGFEIAMLTYKLAETFPKEERFGLFSQMTRAAVSIPSNIAEGSSRSSSRDYIRFMEIALGSCFELHTQLLIASKLAFGDELIRNQLVLMVERESRMLQSFKNKLKESLNCSGNSAKSQ
jgi:four helix bundle protein